MIKRILPSGFPVFWHYTVSVVRVASIPTLHSVSSAFPLFRHYFQSVLSGLQVFRRQIHPNKAYCVFRILSVPTLHSVSVVRVATQCHQRSQCSDITPSQCRQDSPIFRHYTSSVPSGLRYFDVTPRQCRQCCQYFDVTPRQCRQGCQYFDITVSLWLFRLQWHTCSDLTLALCVSCFAIVLKLCPRSWCLRFPCLIVHRFFFPPSGIPDSQRLDSGLQHPGDAADFGAIPGPASLSARPLAWPEERRTPGPGSLPLHPLRTGRTCLCWAAAGSALPGRLLGGGGQRQSLPPEEPCSCDEVYTRCETRWRSASDVSKTRQWRWVRQLLLTSSVAWVG